MKFKSSQIKGKGRGKLLGFPTINLEIPTDFKLIEGIYAVKVFLGGKGFIGALHFGPVPTYNENEKTLEVFLIDAKDVVIPNSENLEIEIIKYLRPVLNFKNQEDLVNQIGKDVTQSRKILNP